MNEYCIGIRGDCGQASFSYQEIGPRFDKGIRRAVRTLMDAGIPTIESCEERGWARVARTNYKVCGWA